MGELDNLRHGITIFSRLSTAPIRTVLQSREFMDSLLANPIQSRADVTTYLYLWTVFLCIPFTRPYLLSLPPFRAFNHVPEKNIF